MLGRGNRPRFVKELLLERGIDCKRRIQHFDRNVALEEGIVCAEYGGEATLSEELAELELLSEGRLELGPQPVDVDVHRCSSERQHRLGYCRTATAPEAVVRHCLSLANVLGTR